MNCSALLVALIVFLPSAVLAYEPMYAGSSVRYNVDDPAKAVGYYAKLPGKTARYTVYFAEPGNLRVSLRIPDIPSADKNVMMQIHYKDENQESQHLDLSFSNDEWKYYKDEFTRNAYYLGPEANVEVASGTHSIVISSPPDNEKPYVLIIGDQEDESLGSTYTTFKELAKIKNEIYSELPLTAYINIYGVVLAIPVVMVLSLLFYGGIRTYLNFKKMDEQADQSVETDNGN